MKRCYAIFVSLVAGVTAPALVGAQVADSTGSVPAAVFVGSETEDYLRLLQTLGIVPLYPWSIRGFGPRELERLRPRSAPHPWSARPDFRAHAAQGAVRWEVIPLRAEARYNSDFPFGMNDGPIWAGRGLTSSLQGGAAVRWGAVSLVVAPVVFRSENTPFTLAPTGGTGPLQYADPDYWPGVDLPQRFGDRPYQRFDPGQTTLRVDLGVATIGASTANDWWGPAIEYPYILGNNAAGFPHVFIGSARPLSIGIGRIHGRVLYGELSQSDYTAITGLDSRRFASGLVGVFVPRWVPGLELGTARFYHTRWPARGLGWRAFRKPFEAFLKAKFRGPDGAPVEDRSNQLASAFLRWVAPRSGFEVYGEFGREDHSFDSRDLLQEVDHASTLGIGFRKAWLRSNDLLTLRGEILDYRTPNLWRHRGEGAIYLHSVARQGHTQRGQLLGADLGVGTSQGMTLAVERYTRAGSSGLSWRSRVRRDALIPETEPDVQHVLAAEHTVFRGPLEIGGELGGIYEFNRDWMGDARNLFLSLRIRWRPL